jgi:fumarate reductase iron-sulfur subunit
VGWKPDYLGPAALNRAFTLVNDVRDGAGIARVRAIARDGGCVSCHTHQSCTKRWPKHLSPTGSIAALKRIVARSALKGEL